MTPTLREAAQAVVREALDAVAVHPCDEHNDDVRALQLFGAMAGLRAALANEPQAEPASVKESLTVKHRQGCDALGGYGHGVGPCSCGAEQPGAVGLSDAWIDQLIEEMGFSSWSEWPEYRPRWLAFARAAVERAALAATQPAAPGWMPIETAPKTGRALLLGYLNRAGKWRTVRGEWMSQDYIDQNWEDPDTGEPGWFETSVEAEEVPDCWPIDPTHWQPLPPPPAATQAQAQDKGDAA